ncbi:hypothetical protein PRIPAC_97977 [Pristionchus pacificus]|uniref:Uncharacterized protein n=1 Tax=Pristionchus pacificus TaxID=54126 RepID=A0A2A6BK23_PRIPA|nr:hypothetical protein PRIPAC_97977 [Pristionchus pacificus]|eukprot:PDM66237.1 hypothetical protein PRIPAC_45462 [Pristionchus pacificus]
MAASLVVSSLFLCLLLSSMVLAADEPIKLCATKLASYYAQLPCDGEDAFTAKASAIDTSTGLIKCCVATGCSKYYLLKAKCQ